MARYLGWSVGSLVAACCALAPSAEAATIDCSADRRNYTMACGPQFVVPSWTDAGGWDDPSHYSTIQLADVNGDAREELIARADDGVEIFWFDTTLGQWRPQADAKGLRQALTEFATPPPSNESTPQNPALPQYYSTIQAVDVDGDYAAEIIGRFWDGMRVYKYTPPDGGNAIDGGTWTKVGTGGPFSDGAGYGDASLYSTIRVGQFEKGDPPVLFARRHASPGQPSFSMFTFNNGSWTPLSVGLGAITGFSDQECGQPSCYHSVGVAPLVENSIGNLFARPTAGLMIAGGDVNDDTNFNFDPDDLGNAFSDTPGTPDCPFSAAGYSGPGGGDCVGSSPSYYETLRAANVNNDYTDAMVVRAADGVRLRLRDGEAGPFSNGATLTDLQNGAGLPEGSWSSIRIGDVNSDAKDDLLALDENGMLRTYTYDRDSDSWSQLDLSWPVVLGPLWLSDPKYYSTLRVGDVDGDGTHEVVGRGPYGIRTWFYDRRKSGGWERYFETGYPPFPGGQDAAYTALNGAMAGAFAIPKNSAVRDVWAKEDKPDTTDLQRLQADLVRIGGCSGPSTSDPVTYATCTPPAGVAAADWTAVINQLLTEADSAIEVVAFFQDLYDINQSLFAQESSAMSYIGTTLGLQNAANTPAEFSPQELLSLVFGIAGSVAGLAQPEFGAGLAVASYLVAALPSDSATANSSAFNTTYGGLEKKFAQMVSDSSDAIDTHSQLVRQDAGLLQLVGQLRRNGTWQMDAIGIESAAAQGFSLWMYKNLMPTLYMRYDIQNCKNQTWSNPNTDVTCTVPTGPAVVPNGVNFKAIAQPFNGEGKGIPCSETVGGLFQYDLNCSWPTPPDEITNQIWAKNTAASDCDYVPGDASTKWKFGCSVEADPVSTIVNNSWGFPIKSGAPEPFDDTFAAAAKASTKAPVTLGKNGRAALQADVRLPAGMKLDGATVSFDRLLFDAGHGELSHPQGTAVARRVTLRPVGRGRFAGTSGGTRLTLQRSHGRARVTLDVKAASLRAPRACHALPASVRLDTDPFQLESRLVVRNGGARLPLRLTHALECRRDAQGNVDRLVKQAEPKPRRYRSGPAVRVSGPKQARPGTTVRITARVSNRRSTSLWHVSLRHGKQIKRVKELRPRRAETATFTQRVPSDAKPGRFCVAVVASAAGAIGKQASVCTRVQR